MERRIALVCLGLVCVTACGAVDDLQPTEAALGSDSAACVTCLTAIPIEVRNDTASSVSVTLFVATKTRHMQIVGEMEALEPGDVRRLVLPSTLKDELAVPSLFMGLNLPGDLKAGALLADDQVAAAHGYVDLQDAAAARVRVIETVHGRLSFAAERRTGAD